MNKQRKLKIQIRRIRKNKFIKTSQDKYGRLENVKMVCFETKEEANAAIQDIDETTRHTAKEYEPKKQSKNIDNQDKIYTNRAKQKSK